MKNITVTVDDEVYRRARIVAAERDTSVSALVKGFLDTLQSTESENAKLKRLEREIRERILTFSGAERLSRDELHDRHQL